MGVAERVVEGGWGCCSLENYLFSRTKRAKRALVDWLLVICTLVSGRRSQMTSPRILTHHAYHQLELALRQLSPHITVNLFQTTQQRTPYEFSTYSMSSAYWRHENFIPFSVAERDFTGECTASRWQKKPARKPTFVSHKRARKIRANTILYDCITLWQM